MPVPSVKDLMSADDPVVRDDILRRHLTQMQAELHRTQEVVASLEAILRPPGRAAVTHRSVAPTPVLSIAGEVACAGVEDWCRDGIARLYRSALRDDVPVTGVPGGAFSMAYFENDGGPVSVFLPVPADSHAPAAVERTTLPGSHFAVATHAGGFADFDRTYGDLGGHVAEHDRALPDPIREYYLISRADSANEHERRTEVCWPISSKPVAADIQERRQ